MSADRCPVCGPDSIGRCPHQMPDAEEMSKWSQAGAVLARQVAEAKTKPPAPLQESAEKDAVELDFDAEKAACPHKRPTWFGCGDCLKTARADVAALREKLRVAREVLDGVASPLAIDGPNHSAAVQHARDAIDAIKEDA